MKQLRFVLILCTLLAGSSFGFLQAQDLPELFEGPCPFFVPPASGESDGGTIRCVTVIVPEDRQNPDGAEVELAVAIIQRSNLSSQAAPVFYLEGGPGGSAIQAYDFWLQTSLRQDHDIILLDQRGTGYSYPTLDCYEFAEDSEDPIAECRSRLDEEGINLGAYNSRESAADVVDVMNALGLEQVNLYGVSYGTRLALTVIRDAPQRVRSAMIDAVYPPHVNGYDEQVVLAYGAFETLFADCAAEAACNARFPNLREVFYSTIKVLNETPLEMEAEDGTVEEIYGETLVSMVFSAMYDASLVPYMPALIFAAADGDVDAIDAYLSGSDVNTEYEPTIQDDFADLLLDLDDYWLDYFRLDDIDELYAYLYDQLGADDAFFEELAYSIMDFADELDDDAYAAFYGGILGYADRAAFEAVFYDLSGDEQGDMAYLGATGTVMYLLDANDGDSEGAFNSVECVEELPFNSLAVAEELSSSVPIDLREALLLSVEGQFADCAVWDVPAAPDLETQPVLSDVPTLVVSGRYDPITPASWGDAAAQYLSRSTHIVLNDMGHGAIETSECATQIALAFLASPENVVSLDLSCVASVPLAQFYIPG